MKKQILTLLMILIMPSILFAGEVQMLKNGVTLIEKPRDFTETVAVAIFINGGLFRETKSNNGIGSLASRVWVKSNKILESSEFYGGFINAKVTPYAFEISFAAPTESIEKMMADFENFLLAPKFDKVVFEREKALLIDELESNKDNPNAIAYERFNEEVFAGTPYALATDGKIESIKDLTVEDINSYYKSSLQGKQMVVAVAGNFDKAFIERLKKALLKIVPGKVISMDFDNKSIKTDKRIEDNDSRIKQAKMYIGYEAPDVRSPDYPAVKVLTELLGGGMSSRYFDEIRKNLGYAYSVGAAYPSRSGASRFFASVGLDYANTDDAIKKIDEINKNLGKTITDEEITKAKNALLGSSLIETQSNSAVAWNAAFFESMGLGADYYDKYVETLQKISKKELINAAKLFKGPKIIYILKPN